MNRQKKRKLVAASQGDIAATKRRAESMRRYLLPSDIQDEDEAMNSKQLPPLVCGIYTREGIIVSLSERRTHQTQSVPRSAELAPADGATRVKPTSNFVHLRIWPRSSGCPTSDVDAMVGELKPRTRRPIESRVPGNLPCYYLFCVDELCSAGSTQVART
jgi:hypothetical protein